MATVIVPIDFSETSLNAAHYAAAMFNGRTDITLILYHYYQDGDNTAEAQHAMIGIRSVLLPQCPNIETQLESGEHFIDSLAAFAHVKGAHMVVMGLTGKTPLAQRFSGTNTLRMAEKEVCPVLIVPPHAQYKAVANVLVVSEMKYVEEGPVLLAIKKVLQDLHRPALHILNVDSHHYVSLTTAFKEERDKMEELLAEFRPEFYFMRLFDFHESVNLFVEDKKIDMIIIAPQHHSFFERLFKTQHTKLLVYQSSVPVLAIHE
jgi:nucleotide-binding universal stress UspA family protein